MKSGEFSDIFFNDENYNIRNNLQLVNSLLRIQARHYPDLTIQDFNTKSKNRIQIIKLIQDNIDCNLDKVNMTNYMKSLAELFDYDSENISFKINLNEVILDQKIAIPVGMIINELISNSILHAFKNKPNTSNNITLTIKKEHTKHLLTYTDNGIGFNKVSFKKKLGLEIINLLTLQIKAKSEEKTTNGVEYKIWF